MNSINEKTSSETSDYQQSDDEDQSLANSILSQSSASRSSSIEINADLIDQIRDAFSVFDRQMTGSITVEQFSKVLDNLGYQVPETELISLIGQLDTDKSGTVEFEEYLSFMLTFIRKNLTNEENLRDAFQLFDQDQDGFIGPSDLRQIMNNLGERVTDEDIDEMIREADLDKDFKVNFYEFQRVMSFR